jgi:hypothetical protein
MTPKLKAKARSIAATVNITGESACVWILDRGADVGSGAEYPPRVPFAKHVGRYSAPCSHGDIADDIEHVLDELAHNPKPGQGPRGKPRKTA